MDPTPLKKIIAKENIIIFLFFIFFSLGRREERTMNIIMTPPTKIIKITLPIQADEFKA